MSSYMIKKIKKICINWLGHKIVIIFTDESVLKLVLLNTPNSQNP